MILPPPLNKEVNKKQGFTLIELSIVLVIIGLLVGGVTVGMDLVEAAKMRGVQTDFQKVITATNTFRLKYNCLPGDCPNATQFFDAPSSCNGGNAAPTEVCNGDGDKIVGGPNVSNVQRENFFYWRSLQASELFDGRITETAILCPGYGCRAGVAGEHSARGSFNDKAMMFIVETYTISPSNAWMTSYVTPSHRGWASNNVAMPFNYTNALVYGQSAPSTGSTGFNPIGTFSPNQAAAIDRKFDDGFSNAGRMVSTSWPNSACTLASSETPAGYLDSDETGICGLVYLKAF